MDIFSEKEHFAFQKNVDSYFKNANAMRGSENLTRMQKAALFAEDVFSGAAVHQGNKVLSYLQRNGRVNADVKQFSTFGEVLAATPGKRLALGYGQNLLFSGAIEYGFMGKELSVGNVFETLSHNAAFTLSSELAGSLGKGIGWNIGGAMLGLGPWQTLGLQTLMATNPMLGWGAALAIGAYKAGKSVVENIQSVHDMGAQSRRPQFNTNDRSYMTGEAATMRQRSLMAIQKSQFSMRNALGNEAAILAGR